MASIHRSNGSGVTTINAGGTQPVKFSLDGFQGLAVLDGAPDVPAGGVPDARRIGSPIAAAASEPFAYDAATDWYKFTWKTQKAWDWLVRDPHPAPGRRPEPTSSRWPSRASLHIDAGRGILGSPAGVGMSRVVRTGVMTSGMTARNAPSAPTRIAGCSPTTVAMIPPAMVPSGIVPQTMKRMVAFIRPCIDVGVMACRKLSWLML